MQGTSGKIRRTSDGGRIISSEENVDKFREKINACANLTEDDLIPKIKIDIPMPAA